LTLSRVYFPQCRVVLSVVFDGFGGDDSEPTVIQIIPKEAQVYLNGYKEADTWELSFDAKALPFSPDIVRALGVEIYMFDAGAVNADVSAFANFDNLLCAGLADNVKLEYSTQGRVLTCDGRDYTALLLDRQWDPKKKVPHGKKLAATVQELADEAVGSKAHGGRTIQVHFIADAPEPTTGAVASRTKKNGKPVQDKTNYWDVIYKMCLREGFIAYVSGFNLYIADPQTLTLQNSKKIRKVAYGWNLSSLNVERKLGKEKTPQIKVTSYSSKQRKTLEAKFPENKDKVTTGIGTEKDEVQTYVIKGIDDITTLKRVAETMYNNLARSESKIVFTTKDLKDLDNLDLLHLRAGDPVMISFDPFNDGVLRDITTAEERYRYLQELGYSRTVASLVAREYDKISQFQRPFYVKEVGVTWSAKDGISFDVEAINFVSVNRDDQTAKDDPHKVAQKISKPDDQDSVTPSTPESEQ